MDNVFALLQYFNAMRKKISIFDFHFERAGYGHYYVTYTSPTTYKQWSAITDNMSLIDATKNAEEPKRKDLEELKMYCKRNQL